MALTKEQAELILKNNPHLKDFMDSLENPPWQLAQELKFKIAQNVKSNQYWVTKMKPWSYTTEEPERYIENMKGAAIHQGRVEGLTLALDIVNSIFL